MLGKIFKRRPHQVVFHTYPKLLFAWPIVIAGFLLWFLADPTPGRAVVNLEVLGWLYLLMMTAVVMTIGIDLQRDHAVFWLVVFAACWFLGMWLEDVKHFTLFGDIYRFFADIDVYYNRGFGLGLSTLLAGPYIVMLVWARIQHRWRITHNEFEHYSWGRADDSLARGAKRVRSTYPDLLELLLCGAGTLHVYSATGRTELRRIPNVPLIFVVRKRVNRLLESTAVTSYAADMADIVEEEAEEDEAGERDQTEHERLADDRVTGNEPL